MMRVLYITAKFVVWLGVNGSKEAKFLVSVFSLEMFVHQEFLKKGK